MARSSGPDKATVKESDSSSNSSSGSGNDTDDSSDDNVEDDDSSVAEMITRNETPFVPGLLDVRIHISSNGKMRKAPQIAELKPDPKQKKRGILMFYSSNIYIIIDNCH